MIPNVYSSLFIHLNCKLRFMQKLHVYVHRNFFHYFFKLEATKVFFSWWMSIYPYSGIHLAIKGMTSILNYKTKWINHKCILLNEKAQIQNYENSIYIILLEKRNWKNKKQIRSSQGLEGGRVVDYRGETIFRMMDPFYTVLWLYEFLKIHWYLQYRQ